MCKHLEALMPRMDNQSAGAIFVPDVDKLKSQNTELTPDRDYEIEFRKKLKKYGLEQFNVELLVRKFIFNETLEQISREMGIPSAKTVHSMIEASKKKLKDRGYTGG